MKITSPSFKHSGFTIIEILVMAIIILILAALIMPRFLDLESKVQEFKVKENMKTVQKAAEDFALKNNGYYPAKANDPAFQSFFPGGNADNKSPQAGKYPENPFTHTNEAPLPGNIVDIQQTRFRPPFDLGGPRMAGKIFYNSINSAQEEQSIGYAIVAADKYGKALTGPSPNMTYILSNLFEHPKQ